MGAEKSRVLNYLEMRYDFVSARNVLNNWRKAAEIKDDPDFLDDNALKSLLSYLKDNAADAGRVHAAIERLILGGDDAPAAPADAPVEDEAPSEDAPAEDVAEAPAEEAPAEDFGSGEEG